MNDLRKQVVLEKLALAAEMIALKAGVAGIGGAIGLRVARARVVKNIAKARKAGKPWDTYLTKNQVAAIKSDKLSLRKNHFGWKKHKLKEKGIARAGKKFDRGPF